MTENEAIKILQEEKTYMDDHAGRAQSEAFQIAINALEKQIAKKPVCIEDKMWCCPVCDNHLLHKWVKYPTELMPKTEGLPYCMSCGQKIDFGE